MATKGLMKLYPNLILNKLYQQFSVSGLLKSWNTVQSNLLYS